MADLSFLDYFEELEDPRIDRKKLYPVDEMLLTTLCAVICGSEGWSDVEIFGKCKADFLKQYLPFKNGIPSDDTFRRFFCSIDSKTFQDCFIEWVSSLKIPLNNKLIAIDGKTLRRSHDGEKRPFIWLAHLQLKPELCWLNKKLMRNPMKSRRFPNC